MISSIFVTADEHDHIYKENEEVVLWMNTIGPYSNRQETYSYYSLPFCRGEKQSIDHYHETLGEALLGVELEYSGLDIRFKGKYMWCKWQSFKIRYTNDHNFQLTKKTPFIVNAP